MLERGASLEAKDEDGEIPLHGACAAGTIYAHTAISFTRFHMFNIVCQLQTAGFANIVQLLLNKGNEMDIMKRMLESVDEEGDTVSLFLLTTLFIVSSESLFTQLPLFFVA